MLSCAIKLGALQETLHNGCCHAMGRGVDI